MYVIPLFSSSSMTQNPHFMGCTSFFMRTLAAHQNHDRSRFLAQNHNFDEVLVFETPHYRSLLCLYPSVYVPDHHFLSIIIIIRKKRERSIWQGRVRGPTYILKHGFETFSIGNFHYELRWPGLIRGWWGWREAEEVILKWLIVYYVIRFLKCQL